MQNADGYGGKFVNHGGKFVNRMSPAPSEECAKRAAEDSNYQHAARHGKYARPSRRPPQTAPSACVLLGPHGAPGRLRLMDILAMVILAGVVLVEKTWSWGPRFSRAAGVTAMVLATAVIFAPGRAPGLHGGGQMA